MAGEDEKGGEPIGTSLRMEPLVRAPLVDAHNLRHLREIASGATPIPSGTFPTLESSMKRHPSQFGVVVYDDSMSCLDRGFHIGDVAIVYPEVPWDIGDVVIAAVPPRGRIVIRQLKSFEIDDDGHHRFSLASFTRKLPSIEAYAGGEDGPRILGVVVASQRSL